MIKVKIHLSGGSTLDVLFRKNEDFADFFEQVNLGTTDPYELQSPSGTASWVRPAEVVAMEANRRSWKTLGAR